MRKLTFFLKMVACTLSGALLLQSLLPAAPARAEIEPTPPVLEDVVLGEFYGLGLDSENRVWSWGEYRFVDMDWDYTDYSPTPVRLANGAWLDQVEQIAGGRNFALALQDDGVDQTVWAWGENHTYQLGNMGIPSSAVPIEVPLPNGTITEIAAGAFFGLALVDGQVYAWGDSPYGQAGSFGTDVDTPQTIKDVNGHVLTGIVDIVAGYDFAYAINGSGTVYGWGNSMYGRLGFTPESPERATALEFSEPVARIYTGWSADHSFGVTVSGAVYGWGDNYYDQIGASVPEESPSYYVRYVAEPTLLPEITAKSPISIAVGDSHTLFVSDANDPYGLGYNGDGLLGTGDYEHRSNPSPMYDGDGLPLTGATKVVAGEFQSMVLFPDKAVAMGDNDEGVLPIGTEWLYEPVATPEVALPLLENKHSITFDLIDYSGFEGPFGCDQAELGSEFGSVFAYTTEDGHCMFADIVHGDEPAITFEDDSYRYQDVDYRVGSVTADIPLQTIDVLPSWIPYGIDFVDEDMSDGSISGTIDFYASQWNGEFETEFEAYFVDAVGQRIGDGLGAPATSTTIPFASVPVPVTAVGIQISVTNTLNRTQAFELPNPIPILDLPAGLPYLVVKDMNPFEFVPGEEGAELDPVLVIEEPASPVYAYYEISFWDYMYSEGMDVTAIGKYPAGGGPYTIADLPLMDHIADNIEVLLTDASGNALYDFRLYPSADNIAAMTEHVFTPNEAMATPTVSFTDIDATSAIGGTVAWTYASSADTSSYAGHRLYFVNEAGQRIAPILKTISAYSTVLNIPRGMVVPEGAVGIGVFPYTSAGEEPTANPGYYAFGSTPPPTALTGGFVDTDLTVGEIGGMVWWDAPADETEIASYDIYLADASQHMIDAPIATVPKGMSRYGQGILYNTPIDGAAYLVVRSNGGNAKLVLAINDTTPSNSRAYEAFIRGEIASTEPLTLVELLQYARSHPEAFGTVDAYRILLKLTDPRSGLEITE